MKKILLCFTAACAAAMLLGCGKKEPLPVQTAPVITIHAATQPKLTAEEISQRRLQAYCQTVENFAYEQILPDGRKANLDSAFGAMEGNSFALQDVDGDGTEELLLSFSTCPMAEMSLYVCGYDGYTDTVTLKLQEFPGVTFYPGGAAVAELSHNHGMAGDKMWPYTVYTYDPEKGAYLPGASADGWDRTLGETDYNGEPFPENVDLDGDGYVYLISRDGATRYLDGGDYEAWRETQGFAVEPLTIAYHSVTRDNIRAVFSR